MNKPTQPTLADEISELLYMANSGNYLIDDCRSSMLQLFKKHWLEMLPEKVDHRGNDTQEEYCLKLGWRNAIDEMRRAVEDELSRQEK